MTRSGTGTGGAFGPRVRAAVAGVCMLAVAPATVQAAPPTPRREAVVARVGTTRVITVGELEDAIARMPSFQRATYGATPDAIRRAVLTEVLVPAALLSISAEARGVEAQPGTARSIEWARSGATARAIRAAVGSSPPTTDDVRAYYEANRARFESPERYRVFRILCDTRDDAQHVLDAAKADPTLKTFGELARDHSVDKGSNLRAGDLGFVTIDGKSPEPGLVVDPAIVAAAARVRDGDLVSEPVAEGDRFAVVWRRGTLAAVHRSLGDPAVAESIRLAILDDRAKEQTTTLVARLRAAKVRDEDAGPLDSIETPSDAPRDAGRD